MLSFRDRVRFDAGAPWVRSAAFRYARPGGLSRADLVGAGNLGLARAVARFDAARGVAFRSFAIGQIRGAVLEEIRGWSRIPRWAEKEDRKNGSDGTPGDGSNKTNGTNTTMSPRGQDRGSLLADVMSVCGPKSIDDDEDGQSGDLTAALALSRIENAQLWACVDRLLPSEARVVRMHYRDGMTFAQVAEARGVCEGAEYKIHARAMKKLRRMISESV